MYMYMPSIYLQCIIVPLSILRKVYKWKFNKCIFIVVMSPENPEFYLV